MKVFKKMENENPAAPAEKKEEPEVNYKEELEKVQKELGQAQHKIIELKQRKQEVPEIDVEAIKQEAVEVARKEVEQIKVSLVKDVIAEELKSIADEDERKLVELHYNNTLVRTGTSREDIKKDIERARAIANWPKTQKTISEMKQSAISKNTQSSGSASSHDVSNEAELSPEDESFVKKQAARLGLSEDAVKKKLLENRNRTY